MGRGGAGNKTRSELLADKWFKLYNQLWLFPVTRLDREFAQKKEKQQGWEMMKAKVASLEKLVVNFESENHVSPNDNVLGSKNIPKYRLVDSNESHCNLTARLFICHVCSVLSKYPFTVHLWFSSFLGNFT